MNLCLVFAIISIGFFGAISYETYCTEKTKQAVIQLQIEMIKAGVTNIPPVKVP